LELALLNAARVSSTSQQITQDFLEGQLVDIRL